MGESRDREALLVTYAAEAECQSLKPSWGREPIRSHRSLVWSAIGEGGRVRPAWVTPEDGLHP